MRGCDSTGCKRGFAAALQAGTEVCDSKGWDSEGMSQQTFKRDERTNEQEKIGNNFQALNAIGYR